MLSNIDVRRSESFVPRDKEQIHAVVTSEVGMDKVNAMISSQMRQWVGEELTRSITDDRLCKADKLARHWALSRVYFDQGKFGTCVEKYSNLKGVESLEVASAYNELGKISNA